MKLSSRGAVPPFIVMDVMRQADARAAAGHRVIHLEVGQPSTSAPAAVRAAATAAIASERLGYTDALGTQTLRQRIAHHYGESYDLDVDWRRVVITTGSSAAFLLAFLAAFDAGDRVAVAVPGYPAYRHILRALNADVALLPVDADTGFQPTPHLLASQGNTLAGIVVASPANPTGSMLSPEKLRLLVEYCLEHGQTLVSDEIYHGITYEMPAATALTFSNETVIINSFSKYYSMTGWRLGWMVVPSAMSRSIECLAQNLYISPPAISQQAACAAFDCRDELNDNVTRYAANRHLLLRGLPKAGFASLAPADGAFYVYARLDDDDEDALPFVGRMLQETGIAATPGDDFDPQRGRRYVRFSFAGDTQDVTEAVERLINWRNGRSQQA